jgi:hypothetical protein
MDPGRSGRLESLPATVREPKAIIAAGLAKGSVVDLPA